MKYAAKKNAQEEAADPESDDEKPGDEEIQKAVASRISALSVVEKRAFKYFSEKDMPRVTMNNMSLSRTERYAIVLDHFHSMSPEARQKYMQRAERHYKKKHKSKGGQGGDEAAASAAKAAKAAIAETSVKKGDWNCDCGAIVAADDIECHLCKAAKPGIILEVLE